MFSSQMHETVRSAHAYIVVFFINGKSQDYFYWKSLKSTRVLSKNEILFET